jgi:hypothetical protein
VELVRLGKCLIEDSCEDISQREVKTDVTCSQLHNDARSVVENIRMANNTHSRRDGTAKERRTFNSINAVKPRLMAVDPLLGISS